MSLTEEKEYMEVDGVKISRKRTIIEKDTEKRKEAAHEYVTHLPATSELPEVKKYMPRFLNGAIFCGHLVTDMDSIAGSIGAAELYGGYAARASEINSETKHCLEHWGADIPPPIEELLVTYPDAGVCLVDHQQTSQLNKAINVSQLMPPQYFTHFSASNISFPLFLVSRLTALWASLITTLCRTPPL